MLSLRHPHPDVGRRPTYADEDPDRVSFITALRIARHSVAQRDTFPPQDAYATSATCRRAIARVLLRLSPMCPRRSNPHVIKRKMPKWHVKLLAC